MNKKSSVYVLMCACFLCGLYWWLTLPKSELVSLSSLKTDLENGEKVFYAAGCKSCHLSQMMPGENAPILGGGRKFVTKYGIFYAPNISMSKIHGIGDWAFEEFSKAVKYGISPEKTHYFPAFPYGSYRKITNKDVKDLWAFWQTLPASEVLNIPHEIAFPYNIRRNIGIWKKLFISSDWVVKTNLTLVEERGRYLVEGLGHCGECHTPRNIFGGLKKEQWLYGVKNFTGGGNVPNITASTLNWSVEEISEYLFSGFTPDFDTASGHMAEVIENLSRLPRNDHLAIARYLKRTKVGH